MEQMQPVDTGQDYPLHGEIMRLMRDINGTLEISATALLHLLNSRVDEQTRNNPKWPQNPHQMGCSFRHFKEQLNANGVRVQRIKKRMAPGQKKKQLIRLSSIGV